jgi:hypothetical protein
LRAQYLEGLALCFEAMWDLAMEMLGMGAAVPYARCVEASTGAPPEPSDPTAHRDRLAELLAASDRPRCFRAGTATVEGIQKRSDPSCAGVAAV